VSNFLGRKNTRKSTRKKGRGGFPLTRPSCRESTGVPRPKSGTLPRSSSGKRPRELVERDGFYFDKQRFFLRTVFPRFTTGGFSSTPLGPPLGPTRRPGRADFAFSRLFPREISRALRQSGLGHTRKKLISKSKDKTHIQKNVPWLRMTDPPSGLPKKRPSPPGALSVISQIEPLPRFSLPPPLNPHLSKNVHVAIFPDPRISTSRRTFFCDSNFTRSCPARLSGRAHVSFGFPIPLQSLC